MSTTISPEECLRRMERRIRQAPRLSIRCDADGYHEGGVANNIIIRSQAKLHGRVPGFLDESEDSQAVGVMVSMFEAWMNCKPHDVLALARRVSVLFVDAVKRHIAEGRSKEGPMNPLTPRYAAIKKYVWHAEGKPILVRTGELLRSLVPAVSVRR